MKNDSEAKAGPRLEEVVSQGDVAHFLLAQLASKDYTESCRLHIESR